MNTITVSSDGQMWVNADPSRQVGGSVVTVNVPMEDGEIAEIALQFGVDKKIVAAVVEVIRRLECRRLGLKP